MTFNKILHVEQKLCTEVQGVFFYQILIVNNFAPIEGILTNLVSIDLSNLGIYNINKVCPSVRYLRATRSKEKRACSREFVFTVMCGSSTNAIYRNLLNFLMWLMEHRMFFFWPYNRYPWWTSPTRPGPAWPDSTQPWPWTPFQIFLGGGVGRQGIKKIY